MRGQARKPSVRGARLAAIGREEGAPQLPVPPTYSVDTPDDEPLDAPETSELDLPIARPNKKRVPDEEHGTP